MSFTLLSPERTGPFIFSCEHASNALPPNITPSAEDAHFLGTHWGWDIGAGNITSLLTKSTLSSAVLATTSRLWIDLNRALDRGDLVRKETEGHSISFNQNLSQEAEQLRIVDVYQPFHAAFHQLVHDRTQHPTPVILVSIHSFTPVWNGKVRTMDVGVLFDECEDLGIQLAKLLQEEGLFVELNAPYTGKGGLMHSVEDKGKKHGCPHLEIELNQALICTPNRQQHIAVKLHNALTKLYDINFGIAAEL